ncbi:MAG TPA: glycine cleavage system protein GcvH [Sedimentisphaerales bacterium]|nr:glycine cleavage system protein GcvH [Sedimentisphaerales bacterium]
MVKEGLLYTKEHEWVRIDGDVVTVGITDHAQEALGEVTFVELPAVGRDFAQGAEMAVVESSKTASDIYAPAAGKVINVNAKLAAHPVLVNEDCYGEGWMCKLKVSGKETGRGLLSAKEYEEYLKGL